ncbi:cupin domain-containing protein [Peribacillus kribbensis]|uniref:cupin domain-containing protein n=1 Tax=Peribacillus kribbensis TaxID=356658 RepID=UPI00040BD5DE|nr:cupin domain-containing protein [Peribacillus kribbensis]
MKKLTVETHVFQDDGSIPNNPSLSVMIYKGALAEDPEKTEGIFNKNNWLNSWSGGVFPYHHYHSNTHEVLGVIKGTARLQIGGEKGKEFNVEPGDVMVLPAGTGHKKLDSSEDFEVAGAYPDGMEYNLRKGKEEERLLAIEDIKEVPLPDKDPVYGVDGPLLENWIKEQPPEKEFIDVKIR